MKKDKTIYFVAGAGETPRLVRNRTYRYKNVKAIDYILKEEEKRHAKKRVRIENLHEGTARAVSDNLFWAILYQPEKHRFYAPPSRLQISLNSDSWIVVGWESFFNALAASTESFKHAEDIIKSVLDTQYPNGNIPNWRSASIGTPEKSHPPVGAFCVLKIFQKSGNLSFLEFAYPYLKRWHSFWNEKKEDGLIRRDGNHNGLLEWGCDDGSQLKSDKIPGLNSMKECARYESGQGDLPNWDPASFNPDKKTLNMDCVDLNSLYALDAWCLSQIAEILNKKRESRIYSGEYKKIRALVNKYLWNEEEGFYFDRFWDQTFSRKKAASNFFPLIARIPNQEQALRIIRHLLNPKEFWGEFVIPTISKDDPAFKDQQYWRGAICPPTNYLVYHGLKAYGFDALAFQFAEKNAQMCLRTWSNFQLCPGNYYAQTGEAGEGRYQSWGGLFALIAMEDYLDISPWDGFRFGMIKPENKGKLRRISIQGRHYDVEVSSSNIKLKEEGKEILKANGGAIFRHFLYSENEVSFDVKTLEEREIKVRFLVKGKYQLIIDNKAKKVFNGKSTKFKVPEGDHSILFFLIDRKS